MTINKTNVVPFRTKFWAQWDTCRDGRLILASIYSVITIEFHCWFCAEFAVCCFLDQKLFGVPFFLGFPILLVWITGFAVISWSGPGSGHYRRRLCQANWWSDWLVIVTCVLMFAVSLNCISQAGQCCVLQVFASTEHSIVLFGKLESDSVKSFKSCSL